MNDELQKLKDLLQQFKRLKFEFEKAEIKVEKGEIYINNTVAGDTEDGQKEPNDQKQKKE